MCQDLSVAGRRRGLAGDRSGLFFEFARIAEEARPSWLLIENVPGLLSSPGRDRETGVERFGADFGTLLHTLVEIGYGVGWRTLDSRFFGVPQRRRRVFIVGALADGDPRTAAERAGQVLAVGTRCPRHPTTRGQARKDVANTPGAGAGDHSNLFDRGGALVVEAPPVAYALTRVVGRFGDCAETYVTTHAPVVAAPLTKGSASGEGVNPPGRRQEDDVNLIAFQHTQGLDIQPSETAWPTLRKNGGGAAVCSPSATVRRLVPRECERLQGLQDDWTLVDDASDSKRYAAIGDAVTANVPEWIGARMLALS